MISLGILGKANSPCTEYYELLTRPEALCKNSPARLVNSGHAIQRGVATATLRSGAAAEPSTRAADFLVAPAPSASPIFVCETFACNRTGAQDAGRGKVRGVVCTVCVHGMRSGFIT